VGSWSCSDGTRTVCPSCELWAGGSAACRLCPASLHSHRTPRQAHDCTSAKKQNERLSEPENRLRRWSRFEVRLIIALLTIFAPPPPGMHLCKHAQKDRQVENLMSPAANGKGGRGIKTAKRTDFIDCMYTKRAQLAVSKHGRHRTVTTIGQKLSQWRGRIVPNSSHNCLQGDWPLSGYLKNSPTFSPTLSSTPTYVVLPISSIYLSVLPINYKCHCKMFKTS